MITRLIDVGSQICLHLKILSEATKSDGATILDFSGIDPSECRVAARHQLVMGRYDDFVCAGNITDPDRLDALLACADSNVFC